MSAPASIADHKAAYANEREQRWSMEQVHGPKVMATLQSCFAAKLELPAEKIEIRSFASEQWMAAYPPAHFEWVKGCPDYFGLVFSGDMYYLFFELKLKKNGIFAKVKAPRGSKVKTSQGTELIAYGCPGVYLDIVPVLKNMNAFCEETGLPPGKFVVVVAAPDAQADEIYVISLESINKLVDLGWNGVPLQKYGEGYGIDGEATVTYLLPLEAFKKISALSKKQVLKIAYNKAVLPDLQPALIS